jgi:hypothetical protein
MADFQTGNALAGIDRLYLWARRCSFEGDAACGGGVRAYMRCVYRQVRCGPSECGGTVPRALNQ